MSDTRKPNHNIIAIASGKGGVGKTWLSVTLAGLFARSGRKTVLFDGDIGLANVDVQLGITPQRDLGTYLSGKAGMRDIITNYPLGGFDIIPGRSGAGNMTDLTNEQLQQMRLDLLDVAQSYDYVILDLGAGIEKHVRFLASIAARTIMVITEEPTSLTDAYAFVKLCKNMPQQPQIQVIVNQASTQKDGQKTYDSLNRACTTFLNISPPCLGIIRRDNKVRDTIRTQQPMLISAPFSTAATDLATISIKLMQQPTS
jgi:flagellar biosynthesis protein FlhG